MTIKLSTLAVGAVIALAAAAGGWAIWTLRNADQLPAGIFRTNGRIEANQVDIATKLAGRIIAIVPREGDMVEAGGVVARLDAAEIEAQIRQAKAELMRARQTLVATEAVVASREAERAYADQELRRTAALAQKGYASQERLDQRRQQLATANAALRAARAQVDEARAAIAAAEAQVDRLATLLDDTVIRSPVRGRVQYRLIEPGAVLGAGGRIATVLDLADVSMTVFLPAREAGRLAIGDEARVVLDAAPEYVFPATVSFVAAEAQFTPKTVETAAEREKLVFRVKLQGPPEILKLHEEHVKSGLRGVAYVRVDRAAVFPASLAVKLPP